VFVILAIIGIFAISALFITKSIDAALLSERESRNKELQAKTESSERAALLIGTSSETDLKEATTTENNAPTPIPEKKEENKAIFSLAILNSTGISGKAGELAKLMTAKGFRVTYTGNAKKLEQGTLIQVKETSKKIFPKSIQEIAKITKNQYLPTETILDTKSEYDAIIIIGLK